VLRKLPLAVCAALLLVAQIGSTARSPTAPAAQLRRADPSAGNDRARGVVASNRRQIEFRNGGPPSVIEGRVRGYVAQTELLELRWNSPGDSSPRTNAPADLRHPRG
jgi:hypothetical protein